MEVPILSLGAAAALASLRAWQEHLPLPDSGEKKFHINANPIQAIHSFIHSFTGTFQCCSEIEKIKNKHKVGSAGQGE